MSEQKIEARKVIRAFAASRGFDRYGCDERAIVGISYLRDGAVEVAFVVQDGDTFHVHDRHAPGNFRIEGDRVVEIEPEAGVAQGATRRMDP
jgi:hypothetical protein